MMFIAAWVDTCWMRLPAGTMAVQTVPFVLGSVAVNCPPLPVVTGLSVALPSLSSTAVSGSPVQVVPFRYCTSPTRVADCPYLSGCEGVTLMPLNRVGAWTAATVTSVVAAVYMLVLATVKT
jgi:hypothetical protein